MELKNNKQGKTECVEVYYECIQKLAHGLQTPTIDNFDHYVLGKIIMLSKDCNCKNEMNHIIVA
jgi:hypothetical protein